MARVGQGITSQLGMSPVGDVIVLDPLLNDLRGLADGGGAPDHAVAEPLLEDDLVIVEGVIGSFLAQLVDVVGELLVETGGESSKKPTEYSEILFRSPRLERRELAHRFQSS